ncbi:MAG: hypothetical protein AB7K52_13610 [Phycisphaerales bacterium]
MSRRGVSGCYAAAAAVLMSAGLALAQPANNACASAEALALSSNSSVVVEGTTVGATADGGTGNCGSSNSTGDVWYTFVAPASGVVTASTCSAASYDTVVSFRSGCPGSSLACNDDACTANRSSVSLSVVAGSTYRIRVSGFSGQTGTFTLTVTHAPPPPPPNPSIGPDVIVHNLTDVIRWGTNTAGDITAFSVGTESCNPGDYPLLWIDNNSFAPDYDVTQHPVIGQNMYRLKSYGAFQRFEQVGQSWLKHGFVSVNGTNCGGCTGANPLADNVWRHSLQSFQDVGGEVLGLNCSDPYGASLNGSQSGLGAKNIVNVATGVSPWVRGNGTGDSTIRERLQCATSDVTGQPVGTRFFVEGQYVSADDAQFVRPGEDVAFNALNNASWREISGGASAGTGFVGATMRQQPAIHAWRAVDPTVTLVSADHDDTANPCTGYKDPVTNDPQYPAGTKFIRSRYWVAAKVTDLGNGTWRYEYAVFNQNSERGAGTFSVPLPSSSDATSFTFNAPKWHSGEPHSNELWTMTKNGNRLEFACTPFAINQQGNAIRWGTMYNFGFTTDVPPTDGAATIGLFKPGTVASIDAAVPVPTVIDEPACPADFNQDGNVDPDDLGDFINCFFSIPACDGADFNQDGNVDPDDLGDFINTFFGPPC